jgi:4-aminobutyrate aminotransferase / (S)-3-amino-2-methylpropionate transaminase / 5-aminovalerate transaminase
MKEKQIPGPKTREWLERGIPLFKDGLRFSADLENAESRGFDVASQIVVDRAEGDFVWDVDGRRYIDFQNGWATNPVGNANREIIDAVDAAHRRYGFHYDHPLRYELAERLAEIMPQRALPRFNYEVSGTDAAEAAVHLALTKKQRRYVITFGSAYHGMGLGTKLMCGFDSELNRYLEAWTGGVIKAPYPFTDRRPAGMELEQYVEYCLWYLDNHVPQSIAPRDSIAAVIVEPGLAEGGNWIPPRRFIRGLRELCDKNDWLLVVDEVLTGLGRTGKMWAIDHYDVLPDILVVGKNLSGGIAPCAGIAAKDEILGDCPEFHSGSTFAGTPAGCAAGLKTLEIFERDGVVEHAAKLGEIAAEVMRGWVRYGIVREARTSGLLLGVGIRSPEAGEKDWWYARAVRSRMLENGVWAISDREDNIRMYPALNMQEETLREGLGIMEEAIRYVDERGQRFGDSPAWPTGDAGF